MSYLYFFGIDRSLRSNTARFPRQDDVVHLTGFPRSANTYASELFSEVWPNLRFSSHMHSIASLKMAIRKKVKVVVLFRDPKSAISSYLVKVGSGRNLCSIAGEMVADYEEYYQFVLDHSDDIKVVHFSEVTTNPLEFLESLTETIDVPHVSRDHLRRCVETVYSRINSREVARSDSDSSIPNQSKERRKLELAHLVEQSLSSTQAQAIHDELYKRRLKS